MYAESDKPEVKESTAETQSQPVEASGTNEVIPEPVPAVEVKVVYKPNTHYFHKTDCYWYDNTCEDIDYSKISEYEGIICSKCNPEISGFKPYEKPYEDPAPSYAQLSDDDRYYLAVMLSHECNPRAGAAHNAQSVAAMVNRVRDGWNSSIYRAINGGCVPYWGGRTIESGYNMDDVSYCYEAIDYYIAHANESPYSYVHSWEAAGDNVHNVYS